MLINLSNHPSENWSNLQLDTSRELYNKIIDVDFPQIPPEIDKEMIITLANDYKDICLDILSSSKDSKNAVHIMGEMTFVLNLVKMLKKEKILCIASTTDRNATEMENSKISTFNFIRFREY
jgi:hypothetical protein